MRCKTCGTTMDHVDGDIYSCPRCSNQGMPAGSQILSPEVETERKIQSARLGYAGIITMLMLIFMMNVTAFLPVGMFLFVNYLVKYLRFPQLRGRVTTILLVVNAAIVLLALMRAAISIFSGVPTSVLGLLFR